MQVCAVDDDFLETYKIPLAEGRFLTKGLQADDRNFVLNESAVRAMGIQSPLGKTFSAVGKFGQIIGIVRDFHSQSLHQPIGPLIFIRSPEYCDYLTVRIAGGEMEGTLRFLEKVTKKNTPGYPFDGYFLDEKIDALYRTEQRMRTVFNGFTSLAVLVAGLGLFGLATFTAQKKAKEIGIRKVLGASVPGLAALVSKEFLALVLLSNLIAWPIGFILMKSWLAGFASRTTIGLSVFGLSAVIALAVALLAVGFQSLHVAAADPIKALKYE